MSREHATTCTDLKTTGQHTWLPDLAAIPGSMNQISPGGVLVEATIRRSRCVDCGLVAHPDGNFESGKSA